MQKEDFLRKRLLAHCVDVVNAARELDAVALDSLWRSLQNITNECKRIPSAPVPLDDSTPTGWDSVDGGGGGGHKVESDVPDPTMPPSGGIAAPEPAKDGAATLRAML